MLLIYGLLIFMVIGAVIAIETRDLLSSVISIGVMGLAMSILFLLLGAPDLAIVQLAVDIIGLILMIRLVVVREDVTIAHRSIYAEVFASGIALIFCGMFIVFAATAYNDLPAFGDPSMRVSVDYLLHGLELSGIGNIVTAIILEFRAYDTLGEATVIFTSILGAFVVLRKHGRQE